MKLYVANCRDRHIDPVIRVFSTPEPAIKFGRKFMEGITDNPLEQSVRGFLLCLNHPCESDTVTVHEVTLDDAS